MFFFFVGYFNAGYEDLGRDVEHLGFGKMWRIFYYSRADVDSGGPGSVLFSR